MKFCPKCGAQNVDEAMFCTTCGNPFSTQTPPMSSSPPPYLGNPQNPPNTNPYQQPPQYGNPQWQPPGQQPQYGYPPYRMQTNQELSTATTFILIAFIFSIIATVLFLIAGIVEGISISYINSVYASYGMKPPLMTGIYAAILAYFIMFIFSIIIMIRVRRIHNLLKMGNTQQAYMLDSVLWGVLGLIFSGLITGLFMLLARSHIKNAGGF
ncbi:MAG: zinc ribbon domain-containing protein [Thermoplasmata archaeon]